ncbi:OmpA family protein [Celeribacter litoreus]|uniref:OmpA family protein n=1 Tax=Celeribacter litoreus TaxID=2876714 RepID=UPI001CD00CE3|nr:OmpA family protein [Celeribacter litoreus]MCA0042286.1 OmpA family protein [Celeribacter litoreus]
MTAKGALNHVAYRVVGTSRTTFQLIEPLWAQLEADGFNILFTCADTSCGGFDFRYLLPVLPEPAMHVDLGNFEYLLAEGDDSTLKMILTSRSPSAGFIQITTLTPVNTPMDNERVVPEQSTSTIQTGGYSVIERLESRGHVVLDDLLFATGSSRLDEERFVSLGVLAEYLAVHPERQIILVGHTDAIGSLADNQNLSRARAEAVRENLIQKYGVTPAQLSAEGIGFLAPLASNATDEGRKKNRRVEAVLASTP